MIYKLTSFCGGNHLEIEQIDREEVSFKITDFTNPKGVYESEVVINKDQLYRLIGALHSIQKSI